MSQKNVIKDFKNEENDDVNLTMDKREVIMIDNDSSDEEKIIKKVEPVAKS
jgi:hypothetical protein